MSQKIFAAILIPATLLAGTCLLIFYSTVSTIHKQQFLEHSTSEVQQIAETIQQLEITSEKLALNAARVIQEIEKFNPSFSGVSLRHIVRDLNISDVFLADSSGKFIKSAVADLGKVDETLFSISEKYKTLIHGNEVLISTPIVRCEDEMVTGPYKYLMIPNHNRTRVIEVSVSLGFVSKALKQALLTHQSINYLSLYGKNKRLIGQIIGASANRSQENLDSPLTEPVFDWKNNELIISTQFPSSSKICYECGDPNGEEYFYYLVSSVTLDGLVADLFKIKIEFCLGIILVVMSAAVLAWVLARRLSARIELVRDGVNRLIKNPMLNVSLDTTGNDEISDLARLFNKMIQSLDEAQSSLLEATRDGAFKRLASQIAHDVRSPLAALKAVAQDLNEMSEDRRLMLRAAIQRISDITSVLLEKSRSALAESTGERQTQGRAVFLPSLLDTVLAEKRMQYCTRAGVEIQNLSQKNYDGLFATVDANELKRVVSNLIDNSMESILQSGQVSVDLYCSDHQIVMTIEDNGSGIAPEILPKLGYLGHTFGKSGGTGLGLYHARVTLERWGGGLKINSELGKGTQVMISLPLAPAPVWFVKRIEVLQNQSVIVLDDDPSIHQIWSDRFKKLGCDHASELTVLKHFHEPKSFEVFLKDFKLNHSDSAPLFLMDYEFMGVSVNGLQLIEAYDLEKSAILVTSHYSDLSLQDDCERLGIKMVPKSAAGFVPMFVSWMS